MFTQIEIFTNTTKEVELDYKLVSLSKLVVTFIVALNNLYIFLRHKYACIIIFFFNLNFAKAQKNPQSTYQQQYVRVRKMKTRVYDPRRDCQYCV